MRISFPAARSLARWGTVAFAGLAFGCLGALLSAVSPPRWLALTAVLAVIGSAASGAWLMRLQTLARHPFRILGAAHRVTFGNGETRGDGTPVVEASVSSDIEFEAIAKGKTSVRLQKFVVEPTSLDARDLLSDWHYRGRIGDDIFEPQPFVSASRSLQLEVTLAGPSIPGLVFTLSEELTFESILDAPARLVFQPSYPSGDQSIDIAFNGPRPLSARYKIDRALGEAETGDLSPEGSRLAFVWRRGQPGEQLAIEWEWDPATLPKLLSETERLTAAARQRQEEFQKILAIQFAPDEGGQGESADDPEIIEAARAREALHAGGQTPGLSGDSGFEDEQQSADDHPIIKAARAREKLYKGEDEN